MSDPAITFSAVVYKVQTLVDGGVRVTLDLGEDCIPQMAMLAECKRQGIVLAITCNEKEPNGHRNTANRNR